MISKDKIIDIINRFEILYDDYIKNDNINIIKDYIKQNKDVDKMLENHLKIYISFENNLIDFKYILYIMKLLYEQNNNNYIKLYSESLVVLNNLNDFFETLLENSFNLIKIVKLKEYD